MKRINPQFSKNWLNIHSLLVFIFFVNVFISHMLLPKYNEHRDYFLFSTWSLFSNGPRSVVYDLSWDQGKTYFFRDHRLSSLGSNFNLPILYHLLSSGQFDRIQNNYLQLFRAHCNCQTLVVQELIGSTYDHIILKKDLTVAESIDL